MYKGASKKRKLPVRNSNVHLCNTRSKTVQNFHPNNCGAVETGVSSEDKDFTPSLKATTQAPSRCFEFNVRSDEGINLCIDLNSSPSDWTNRYRNEVCVSEKVCRKKESRSLWQDLSCSGGSSPQGKSSFIWNTNSGHFDDCNGPTRYTPSLKLVKEDVTGLAQQNLQ